MNGPGERCDICGAWMVWGSTGPICPNPHPVEVWLGQ